MQDPEGFSIDEFASIPRRPYRCPQLMKSPDLCPNENPNPSNVIPSRECRDSTEKMWPLKPEKQINDPYTPFAPPSTLSPTIFRNSHSLVNSRLRRPRSVTRSLQAWRSACRGVMEPSVWTRSSNLLAVSISSLAFARAGSFKT